MKYTAPSRLNKGENTDNKINTIDNGYKNINIGVDQAMICSNPKLAVKNDAKHDNANHVW